MTCTQTCPLVLASIGQSYLSGDREMHASGVQRCFNHELTMNCAQLHIGQGKQADLEELASKLPNLTRRLVKAAAVTKPDAPSMREHPSVASTLSRHQHCCVSTMRDIYLCIMSAFDLFAGFQVLHLFNLFSPN